MSTERLPSEEDLGSFAELERIVARLRAPDGCPWDRQQTHASIKRYLIEETYEAVQALDEENSAKLCEELGDLLLQVMLHSQIAAESDEFNIHDVVKGIATKLVRRHPHVFGDAQAKDVGEVVQEWEVLKQKERAQEDSLLAGVPRGMPALALAYSIQRRAAGVGFDWKEAGDVLEKVAEEVAEVQQAATQKEQVQEFGDLLFSLVNVARWQGIDLEEALRLSNERFIRRFSYIEQSCRKRGVALNQLSLDEMNTLWEEAKTKT